MQRPIGLVQICLPHRVTGRLKFHSGFGFMKVSRSASTCESCDPSLTFLPGPNQWPHEEDLPNFRSRMETLFERYHALNLILNRHICQLLDIPSSALDDFFPAKTEFNSALWHYFPVSPELRKEERDGFVQGMHEHRDPSTFVTCLIQSRPGLQAQNHQGKWIDIPMVEGGVVCNIGNFPTAASAHCH
jgi:isopenicillin N synthase-like dioxygenase